MDVSLEVPLRINHKIKKIDELVRGSLIVINLDQEIIRMAERVKVGIDDNDLRSVLILVRSHVSGVLSLIIDF